MLPITSHKHCSGCYMTVYHRTKTIGQGSRSALSWSNTTANYFEQQKHPKMEHSLQEQERMHQLSTLTA